MAAPKTIDPNSGYCSQTKTYHSLRPKIPLPPPSQPLSVTQYIVSLLHSTTTTNTDTTTFLIDAATGYRLSYSDFLNQTNSLALSLQKNYSLSKGDIAFILSPQSLHIPILYFSLLSLGVIISPTNPDDSKSEITHQIQLSKPTIAFATSLTSHKLPKDLLTISIDSPDFISMLSQDRSSSSTCHEKLHLHDVNQSDIAVIMYSSGTTGRSKGVMLTHRNLIAAMAGFYYANDPIKRRSTHQVSLATRAFFHISGLVITMRAFSLGETLVLLETLEFDEAMLIALEKYKATYMPVAPSYIVALLKSELTNKYDLTSLKWIVCGGAALVREVAEKFKEKFPHVEIVKEYGLTETAGMVAGMRGPHEAKRLGFVGCLTDLMEAKIIDPVTGESLPPTQKGELWLRGPTVMKGYVGDANATAQSLDAQGWLKTGDLCCFDNDGFVLVVDRLKELIKYNGYQVPPAELEHLLLFNPHIADAAVIPYPDEVAGQIPMAFVVRKPGSTINEAEVTDFIAKQVAPHKKIHRVAFIKFIPKSSAGKILRRELVNLALSGTMAE